MLTTLVILGGVLLVLEVLTRLFYPPPPRWPQPQVRTMLDKRSGYLNRPNQNAFTVDAPVTINSLGFRGRACALERTPESLRILGLGNSLSFGAGVADDETYFAYLEKQLQAMQPDRPVEVLNAAIIGFTIRQYIPFLHSVLPKLQPDIVLLGAHWRDLHFNPRFGQLSDRVDTETWQMIKKKFDDRNVNGAEASDFAGRIRKSLKDVLRHWRFLYVCTYHVKNLKEEIKPPNFKQWQKSFLSGDETEPIRQRRAQARHTLERMKALCEKHDARLAIVVFPDYKQITRTYPKSLWPSLLVEICEEAGIPYILLLPAIQEAHARYGGEIFIPYDITHYSAVCNEAIAAAMCDFLQREHFFQESGQHLQRIRAE